MASRLDVGVIGCDVMGTHHARVYSKLPDVRLVGVYDLDATKAIKVARRYGANAFGSLRDLLRSVDAVSIATPTVTQVEMALAAIEHDCHLLIEKPLAASIEEAKHILDRHLKSDARIYMTAHVERFNPTFIALRSVIAGQSIRSMTLRQMSMFDKSGLDTDVIHDLMIDDIDLALTLLGDDITSIDAVGTPVRTSFVDQAMAEISMINDVQVNIIASRVANRAVHSIEIRGDEFRVIADLVGRTIRLLHGGTDDLARLMKFVPVLDSDPVQLEIKHFVDCILGRKVLESDLDTGHRALTVAGCIHDIVIRGNDANPDHAYARMAD